MMPVERVSVLLLYSHYICMMIFDASGRTSARSPDVRF